MNLAEEIEQLIDGDVFVDDETLQKYSRDASLFVVKPQLVIFPKNVDDIKKLVLFVGKNKDNYTNLSLTARSAGSDMTGGPLNESIVLDFTKYLNNLKEITNNYAVVEPGMFYRDFEVETLKRHRLFPSYPASRDICAMGGIVANNAGGEKSLIYGKTIDYVEELKVILNDGQEYSLKNLTALELQAKIKQNNFEGKLYRQIYDLIDKNYNDIQKVKPRVSKNSSGYYLWSVWDKNNFNLAKLIVGSQGTLGIITEIKLRLTPKRDFTGLGVVFMKDLKHLAEVIRKVLPLKPSSFESFDDHTLKLALRFFPGFLKRLGARNLISLGWRFLPDLWTILTFGMPKLVLLVEFEEDDQNRVDVKLLSLKNALVDTGAKVNLAINKKQADKYWTIRRESFNLLRHKIKNRRTAPFIDDIIVEPEKLSEFLPKLYDILDHYQIFYTIAGHIGDGNFHIIPLMNLENENERRKIYPAADEVYKLVLSYGGSISAEHNDGLIRSPYLEQMFGERIYKLFEETKKVFDPQNIFNPGKKVGASVEYAFKHIRTK
ncbi:MAG: FAD-binding oxidoreductase [bacterium]|nr:FAD-binding oxidoreductase [bacterium]